MLINLADPSLQKRLREYAEDSGITYQEIIDRAVRRYLAGQEDWASKHRRWWAEQAEGARKCAAERVMTEEELRVARE